LTAGPYGALDPGGSSAGVYTNMGSTG
jgi:hypothetical protein